MALTDTQVVILLGATALAMLVAIIVLSVVLGRRRRIKVGEMVRALGFAPSRAAVPGARQHWTSPPNRRPTVIGYYPGNQDVSGTAGLMLMMHTGTFGGAKRGVVLSARPPKLVGTAPDASGVEAALSPAVVDAAAGLPQALLAPGEGLMPGTLLHEVVAAGWPGGWQGLHLRVVLSIRSDLDAVEKALSQMEQVAQALVQVDPNFRIR